MPKGALETCFSHFQLTSLKRLCLLLIKLSFHIQTSSFPLTCFGQLNSRPVHNPGRGGAFPKYEFLYCCWDWSRVSAVSGMESPAGANEPWQDPGHDLDGRSLQPSELLSCPTLPTRCPLSLPSPGSLESLSQVLCAQLIPLCVIIPCSQAAFAVLSHFCHTPHLIRAGCFFYSHGSLHVHGISACPGHSTGATSTTRGVGGWYWGAFTGRGEEKN